MNPGQQYPGEPRPLVEQRRSPCAVHWPHSAVSAASRARHRPATQRALELLGDHAGAAPPPGYPGAPPGAYPQGYPHGYPAGAAPGGPGPAYGAEPGKGAYPGGAPPPQPAYPGAEAPPFAPAPKPPGFDVEAAQVSPTWHSSVAGSPVL
jgi:hypothetical protein